MKRFFFDVWEIGVRCSRDKVTIYSAYAALFLIIAVFPFLMLLLGLIQYVPIPQDLLLRSIAKVIPQQFMEMVEHIINELMSQSSGTVVSVTAVTAIWASSRGVMGLLYGINAVYHTTDDRNWLVMRSVSILYTVMFLILIIATLLLLVFGNQWWRLWSSFFHFYMTLLWVSFLCGRQLSSQRSQPFLLCLSRISQPAVSLFFPICRALCFLPWADGILLCVFLLCQPFWKLCLHVWQSDRDCFVDFMAVFLYEHHFIGGEINAFLIDRKKIGGCLTADGQKRYFLSAVRSPGCTPYPPVKQRFEFRTSDRIQCGRFPLLLPIIRVI